MSGASAIEFVLLAPVLCLVFAGMVDLGLVLYIRLSLNQAASTGANYALVNVDAVSSAGGSALAASLVAMVPGAYDAAVVINNGPSLRRVKGVATAAGTAASADACYCPQIAQAAVSWGSAATCGATCASGGIAGKYVVLTVSEAYSPMFGNGVVANGVISVRAIAEALQ
jgi:Flp pilus assembly protein TadG